MQVQLSEVKEIQSEQPGKVPLPESAFYKSVSKCNLFSGKIRLPKFQLQIPENQTAHSSLLLQDGESYGTDIPETSDIQS